MEYIYKLFNWYFGREALPYWCVLLLDCIILYFCFLLGHYCIYGAESTINYFWDKIIVISFCIIFYLIGFKVFHTYANIIRYSSFVDLRNVFYACALGAICTATTRLLFIAPDNLIFPSYKTIVLTFAFATSTMYVWRVLIKNIFDITFVIDNAKNVFIFGIKHGGVSLAKSIRNQKPAKFIVRGFISPTNNDSLKYIAGVPVFNNDIHLVSTMIKKSIKAVLVSPVVSDIFRENNTLINQLTEAGIRIYMMPDAVEWDGKSDLTQQMLHKVDIEDLLPREKIEIDMTAIGNLLRDHRIMITGAAGSIGSEMVRQIALFNPQKMILVDQAETPMHDVRLYMAKKHPEIKAETIVSSITNKTKMESLFKEYKPEYVFHAAAYKHVPMMENNPSEAVQNNIYGTRVIADLAVKYGTKKFVMISTDKAVNPTNVMGCSKRICEIYVQALDAAIRKGEVKGVTQFVTTRFGNVLGSNGSVIPLFKEQIRNGGPVTVTHPEIIRFFMLIPEACKLVLEAGTFGKGGEIFVFDMGKPVRITDLAKRMIALSKAKNIEIQYTGLRDGEKLFEEVLSDAEKTLPTNHPKIRIAKVRQYPFDEALRNEERLYDASFNEDDMTIVKIMKEIVPEFKSRHSKYEELD